MADMFATGSAWFGLAVGVGLLLEATALFALRHRPGRVKQRAGDRQLPMLLCMGVMLTTSSAARLRGWTGNGMTAVFLIGMAAAAATIVFAVRSLAARASQRGTTPPSR
ncbi:hypothetical protein AB0945_17655 [Streptomyces sp. NPDC005474]|uniref:hypothetical protein n=1 Tax=Streptomyces sp. NPDC005474 TaxID=3154878 RepID=UPI003453B344